MPMRAPPAFGLVLALAACDGLVGEPMHAQLDPAPSLDDIDSAESCGAGPDEPFVRDGGLRRLSSTEYQNTLRALFAGLDIPTVPLPKPVVSDGFENYSRYLNPSDVLVEILHHAAVDVARLAVEQRSAILPCNPGPNPTACATTFIEQFGARAHRRPLSTAQRDHYLGIFEAARAAIDFDAALEVVISAMLQSPHFVYRLELFDDRVGQAPRPPGEPVPLDGYEVASRLSYALWQSMPDDALFEAAAAGGLTTAEGIEAQAHRMLQAPAARAMWGDFARQWLDLDRVTHEEKSEALFPQWSDEVAASAREESVRFVQRLRDEGRLTVTELLTSPSAVVNPEVALLYGLEPVSGWTDVDLDPTERAGILTRAAFLGGHAHQVPSPPLRGVAVLRRVLCMPPPDPPGNIDTSVVPDTTGTRTNRQVFEARISVSGACQGCHTTIDGLGYAFENYDALGRYITEDAGQPIDASGYLEADVSATFTGALEMSQVLAQSQQVQACVATNLHRHAYGRDMPDDEACRMVRFAEAMSLREGDLEEALVRLVTRDAFRHRAPVPQEDAP